MKKAFYVVLVSLLVFSIFFGGCQPKKATEVPTVPATEVPATEVPATEVPATEVPAVVAPAATDAPALVPESGAAASNASMPEVCKSDEKGCAVIKAGETIKLGVGGPMTGEYAMYGEDTRDAELLAVAELQPLEGFSWELLVEDTQGAAEAAVAVANKWITDPSFVAVPGFVFTGESAAVTPIFEKASVPMLSASATGATLTENNSVFNRVVFQDAAQGDFAAKFIAETLGLKQIAVVHDGLDYGKGIADKVKATAETLGVEVVAYEAITPGEADYSAVLTAVASKKPQLIYFGGYVAELSVIASQMAQVGMADVPVFSDDGAFGSEFIEKAGKAAEGCYGTSSIPPASPEKDAFDAKYEKAYGRVAGSKSSFAWFSYDVINVLAKTVANVAIKGEDGNLYVPRAELVKAVRATKGYQGITGEISCSEVGECNASGPTFYVVKDGKWVEAK